MHKENICRFRLLMSLNSLIAIMARYHDFTATQVGHSFYGLEPFIFTENLWFCDVEPLILHYLQLTLLRRSQYEARFQKWELPNLRTLSIAGEVQDARVAMPQDALSCLPQSTVSASSVAIEATAESVVIALSDGTTSMDGEGEVCQPADLPCNADYDVDLKDSHDKQEPEIPTTSRSCITDGNERMQSIRMESIRPRLRNLRSTSIKIIAPKDLFDAMRRYDVAARLTAQDLGNIADAGHFLFAVGSYKEAHNLCVTIWKALLARGPKSLDLLVSAVVNVARSSYESAQLGYAKRALENLIQCFSKGLKLIFTAEFILHAHLADVLRKLAQPSEAAEHCQHALCGAYGWGYDSGSVPKDRRAPALLLYHCSMQVCESYKNIAADHTCLCQCGLY
jgi:Clr5 domain